MNKAELQEMKEDRLANFAVTAFLGALLMGQVLGTLEGSQSTTKLLIFTVPDYSGLGFFAFMSGFFVLSLFLVTASMVAPLQGWGLAAISWAKPAMLFILVGSFILSWVSSIPLLPDNQWWTPVLIIGGFGMFIFIVFGSMLNSFLRFMLDRVGLTEESKSMDESGHGNPSDTETSGMLNRVRGLRGYLWKPHSGEFWITLLAAILVLEVSLAVIFWNWLDGAESASATIRNVGLVIAGSLAIPLAIWRAIVADKQASSAQHQIAITQQGLLNERYQKAAEMLGSDVLSVRIGGVHALRDLAVEQPGQYHVRVMRLLCAFAHNPVKDGPDGEELATSRIYSGVGFSTLRDDMQAVMDVIRSRSNAEVRLEEKKRFRLELQYADLRGASLHGADLRRAILWGADLSGAYLASARLDCVLFNDVKLSDTQFSNEGDDPASGLTQQQLDKASVGIEVPPKLAGVLDAKTRKQLVWRKKPTSDQM